MKIKKVNELNDFYSEYEEEKIVCEYLGLKIDSGHQVLAYYGGGSSDGGKKPTGWQVVCHLSKLKMYLTRKIHPEHNKKIN